MGRSFFDTQPGLAVAGLLVFGLGSVLSPPATARAAKPAAQRMLITPDALQRRCGDKDLRVLDVRPEEPYQAGHIPGAVRVDLSEWREFAKTPGAFHDASAWAKRVGALGIGPDTEVVVYGGELNEAARV